MSPRMLKTGIYGYAILYQPNGPTTDWVTQDSEDAPGIPAVYETYAEAADRQVHIQEEKQVPCRICAVLVLPTDFAPKQGALLNRFTQQELAPGCLPEEGHDTEDDEDEM